MIFKHETNTATYYFESGQHLKEGVWSTSAWSLMQSAFLVLDDQGNVLKNRYGWPIVIDMIARQGLCLVSPIKPL